MFKIKFKLAGEDLVSFNAPTLPPPEEEYVAPVYDEEAAERKRRKRERRERERAAAAAAEAAYGDGGGLEPLYLKPKAPRQAAYGSGFGASGSVLGGATGHKSQLQLLLDMQRSQQFGGADTQPPPGGFGSFSAPFGAFGAQKSSRKREREREREQHTPFAKQPSEALRRPPPRRSANADYDGGELRRRRGMPTPSAPVPFVVRSARVGGPDQPKRHLLEAAVAKLSKVDREGFFQDPVTDAIAPGYSSVVARPMDFTTIRLKMRADAYGSWDELSEDVALIVSNCLLYNAAGTVFAAAAERLKEAAEPIIKGYKCVPAHLCCILRVADRQCVQGKRQQTKASRDKTHAATAWCALTAGLLQAQTSIEPSPSQRRPSRGSCALRRRRCSWCRRSFRARRLLLARSPPLATPHRLGLRSHGRRQRRQSLLRLVQLLSWRMAGAAWVTTRTGVAPSVHAVITRAC